MKLRSIVAATAAVIACAAAASSALPASAPGGIGSTSQPQLLLFHGGAFLFEDRSFEALTASRARAAGFVPHYVDYPLGDLPAAAEAAVADARRLGQEYGPGNVYAYGSSAGGTLAALLAADGLVAGAAAKAPPSNLPAWMWAFRAYGSNYDARVGLTPAEAYRLSPALLPARSPLLILQGREDRQVPASMNEAFAARYPQVHLLAVRGGHWVDRTHPYLISRTLGWLSMLAARNATAHARRH